MKASSGIDKGCSLSPCVVTAAVETFSQYILSQTQHALDIGAKLWAYLDDWYIWIKPQHIPAAIDLASNATRSINLELQPTKIQIWTTSCTNSIPPSFLEKAKSTLKCPERISPYRRRQQKQPHRAGWTALHEHRLAIMRELNQAGLKMQTLHQERGCSQPTRPAHDVRHKS